MYGHKTLKIKMLLSFYVNSKVKEKGFIYFENESSPIRKYILLFKIAELTITSYNTEGLSNYPRISKFFHF